MVNSMLFCVITIVMSTLTGAMFSLIQEEYFATNIIQGTIVETIEGSASECASRCNLDVNCNGVLSSSEECGLVRVDLNATVQQLTPPQSLWLKAETFTVKIVSEGPYTTPEYNFTRDGIFVVNGQIITEPPAPMPTISVLVYDIFTRMHTFQAFENLSGGIVGMLEFINLHPDGSIVMMSVLDTGHHCAEDCKNAMITVGGSGASISWRESFVLLGYKGLVCGSKPSWVKEVRMPKDAAQDMKPSVIGATFTTSSIFC